MTTPTTLFTPMPPRPSTLYRDLHVGSLGHFARKTLHVRARFEAPAIGLVVAGSGTYAVGKRSRTPIGPGTLFCVFPGPTFDYGPNGWWEEYYLGFAGVGVAGLSAGGLLPRDRTPRPVAEVPSLVARFNEMLSVWRRDGPGDADRVCMQGVQLLIDLYAGPRHAPTSADPVDLVIAACRAAVQQPVDWPALAERHGISYSRLRQGIRHRTGLSPAKYLARLRCEAACGFLTTTTAPVKQIARRVGIPDPYAFSRTFHRTMGLSPRAYRDRNPTYGGG